MPSEMATEADTLLRVEEEQPRVSFPFGEAQRLAGAALRLLSSTSAPLWWWVTPFPTLPSRWQAALAGASLQRGELTRRN